jgi:hypothetical protein
MGALIGLRHRGLPSPVPRNMLIHLPHECLESLVDLRKDNTYNTTTLSILQLHEDHSSWIFHI